MRALIRFFDSLLRQFNHVYEFTGDPDCLLRLQITRASRKMDFPAGRVLPGEPLLDIHLWNEHLPPLPPRGADLAWANHSFRLFVRSLSAVAHEVQSHPERYAGIRAVGAGTGALAYGEHASGAAFMRRLGFRVTPARPRLGRFGEFWENFYSRRLMTAFNPRSLEPRKNQPLHRTELWMPIGEFLKRFGGEPTTGA
jgi:hypothetical protein